MMTTSTDTPERKWGGMKAVVFSGLGRQPRKYVENVPVFSIRALLSTGDGFISSGERILVEFGDLVSVAERRGDRIVIETWDDSVPRTELRLVYDEP